ncbi:MAG: hypothetical protein D6803_03695 [Anaerolineae bacterium]|nr:MAG: hypothetical protein D6803_03695 [Anaerolineae bacterium]
MNFHDVVSFFGALAQFIGLLVFGVAVALFVWQTLKRADGEPRLQAAVLLGYFFLSAVAIAFVSPGGVGAYTLGAGAAMLWSAREKDEQSPDE